MIKLISLADLISLTNAIFGFLAILILFSDLIPNEELKIRVSFSLILLALLADGLDGVIARKTRISEIGEYLESISDMTSLIIAPAIFIYFVYHDFLLSSIYNHIYLLIALVLFLLLGAVRLSSFHKMKNKKFFLGLPASASTIILIILSYFENNFFLILLAIFLISIAMITNIKFPKPSLKVNATAAALIILTIILGKEFYGFAPIFLIIAIVIYSLGGPIYRKIFTKNTIK